MSSFGYQPHPTAPKGIREYRQHRQQVLGAVRDYSFKGVRHKAHTKGTKKAKKVQKKKTTTFIPPQPPVRIGQQQFLGIHNTALSNRARDLKVVENIDKRLKEDKTMTENQSEALKDLRGGLIL